jgi:phosphoribosylpyrophosphate synthetase
VLFLASFHTPDVVFEQLSALYALARYGARSLRVVVPFFATGTMERVDRVGEVATAATLARLVRASPLLLL